jgi:beta-glucosidase
LYWFCLLAVPWFCSGKQTVPAILNAWFAGSEAGNAIMTFCLRENPRKLTYFSQNVGQVPIYYSQKNTGRPLLNEEGNLKIQIELYRRKK